MSRDGENGSQPGIRDLEKRIAELERRVDEGARAFSRHRLQQRRSWLRPPLWVFGPYAPRPLQVRPHPSDATAPSGPLPAIAIVTPTLDRRAYLQATIDSVLGQHYPALH